MTNVLFFFQYLVTGHFLASHGVGTLICSLQTIQLDKKGAEIRCYVRRGGQMHSCHARDSCHSKAVYVCGIGLVRVDFLSGR